MNLNDKVALVAGGGRGIGKITALTLAKAGAKIAVASRTEKEILETCKDIHQLEKEAIQIVTDVRKEKDVYEMVNKTASHFGKIDILVNSAGVAIFAPLHEMTSQIWNENINTNLTGSFFCIRAVFPLMMQQKNGSIINVSSIYGLRSVSGKVAYSASKFGIIGITKCAAIEGEQFGIRVNSICPGPVATEMRRKNYPNDDLSKLWKPEQIADVILFLASDFSKTLNGAVIECAHQDFEV